MLKLDSKGVVPILVLVAAVAVIGFLAIASVAPFKDSLLSALYQKPSSFAAGGTINVNPTQTFQTITGWEATDYAGENPAVFPLYINSLLDQVVNDLGITRLRVEIRSGVENSTDYWTNYKNAGFPSSGTAYTTWRCNRYPTVNDNNDPNVINPNGFKWGELDNNIDNLVNPLRQKMQAKGEKLLINLNYVAFTGQITCGGSYIHDNAAEYAEFVLATYQHMQSKYGFVPDSWEVILEPDNTNQWTGTVIGQAIKAAGDKLAANGYPNVKFIAPSTTCMDRAPAFFDAIKAVPGALNYLEEISYHRYCGASASVLQSIAQRATQNNKKTSHLEHIGSDYNDLHEDLTVGMNSAWQQFTIGGSCNDGWPCSDDGGGYYYMDSANPNSPQIIMGSRTKFLRQYFKFIRPGAVRIDATTANSNFNPVAFINSDGKYVVVVKASSGGNFSIGNLPQGTYGIKYTTDSAYNIDLADQAIAANSLINTNIPASGAITIYQKSSAGPSAAPSAIPSPSASAVASVAPSPSPSPSTAGQTAPTVVKNVSCISAPSSQASLITISWANSSVSYADLSTDQTFGSFYNKQINGVSSTSGPDGFNGYQGFSGALSIQPGVTYYTRTFNGAHSPAISFSIPLCSSPSPSPSPLKTGDLDANNKVDIFDYNILLTDFGKTGSNLATDIDKNGKVDIFDYNILLTNFGK